ncbi:hypothetical protein [Desulfovibrio sp. JC022]|uniref:hypothetical protein n=1 Tax=Desulfovibrio sp. JC022 TaxID=2593642 RepID=UPI0013D0CFA3|nr:hypothetical protein [Desulfovibrio sp. JC022]NDV21167.1 hypothetical protein [Desulfovibrio sp. JC022]
MENHNIAIIGLGRVGTAFLKKTLSSDCVMNLRAVCEMCDTPGRKLAEEKSVPVMELNEIIALGIEIEVIFDLTGDANVSRILHEKLRQSGNSYTDVAPVRVARLVWAMIAGDEYLPDLGKSKNQIYADMLLEGLN